MGKRQEKKKKDKSNKKQFKAKKETIVSLTLLLLFGFSFWYFSNDLIKNFPSLDLIKENLFNFILSFFIVFIGLLAIYTTLYLLFKKIQNTKISKIKDNQIQGKA